MEEEDSIKSEIVKPTYLNLLQQINALSNLSTNVTHSNLSDIETIFNSVTKNIDRISTHMTFQKTTMFAITILNTIVRISAVDGSDIFISREPFRSVFDKLYEYIIAFPETKFCSPMYASDMLDSLFMNLINDDFIEVCFRRLLSDEKVSTEDPATENDQSSESSNVTFHKILTQYVNYASDFVKEAVYESTSKFKNHYGSLIASLQKFLHNCFINTNKNISSDHVSLITSILTLVWSMVDKVQIAPIFIEFGYIQNVMQWIRTEIFASHVKQLGEPIISIIHNLSRNKMGLTQLRTEKAFDVLMKRKQLIDDQDNKELTESFGRTAIAVATSDEQSEENKKLILNATQNLYNMCKETSQVDTLIYDGFHLSEILELLQRALINTYIIKYLFEEKIDEKPTAIQYFAKLFLSFYGVLLDPEPDELEKHAVQCLLKILLQISSYPEYLKQLIENVEFCIVIEGLSNRAKQDDAKRIWCNIEQIMSSDKPKKEMSSKIYISYHYTDEEFCKEFVTILKNKTTIPIWVAYENVELCEDMWEYISPNIVSATSVIILASTAYGESMDKFQELSYIISTNKSRDKKKGITVVTIEPNFKSKRSWMKNLLHDNTVIPYEHNINNVASKVYDQIGVSKKSSIKCLGCTSKNVRRKTIQSDNLPLNDFNPPSISTPVHKESSNINDSTDFLTIKRQYSRHSIVSGVITETGSATDSTWV